MAFREPQKIAKTMNKDWLLFKSMAEAFARGWNLVKESDDVSRYFKEMEAVEEKARAGIPLGYGENVDRILPGHNFESFGYRFTAGREVPKCDFCDNTVYHRPLKTTYSATDTVFCNDEDCLDEAHQEIGRQGVEGAHEITSDHDKGHEWPVGEGEYATGHIGHQDWHNY